jgi:hypothetical protein
MFADTSCTRLNDWFCNITPAVDSINNKSAQIEASDLLLVIKLYIVY